MSFGFLLSSGEKKLEIQKVQRGFSIKTDGKILENAAIHDILELIKKFEEEKFKNIIISSDDPEKIFEIVKSFYDKYVLAGGGIVVNEHQQPLFIFRNGKWDLPKGKIKKDEDVLKGAIREIIEETGLKNLEYLANFDSTYHTYREKGKNFLKKTQWYIFSTTDKKTSPQTEEGITEIKWMDPQNLDEVFKNTFPNIELLLKKFVKQQF